MPDRPDTVNVQVRSFHDLVQDDPLRFEPPRVPGLDLRAAAYWWHQIAYAFRFDDPRSFPPVGRDRFTSDQLEVLERFAAAAEELGESSVLSGEYRLRVDIGDETGESVEAQFPKGENLRGLSVLFRQFYSDEEIASFTRARKVLGEVCAQLEDAKRDKRLEQLRLWRKSHGRMRGAQLEMIVLEEMVSEGRVPPSTLELARKGPNYLISLYNYGELIHFGDKRGHLKELVGAGPFEESWTKMEFLTTVTSFSHFYIGFAELIEAALSDPS